MNKTLLYISIILILSSACNANNIETNRYDRGITIDSLSKILRTYNKAGLHDSTISLSRKILNNPLYRNDTLLQLYASTSAAQAFCFTEQKDSAIKYFNYAEALKTGKSCLDSSQVLSVLYNSYAIYYLKTELDYSRALDYLTKSLEHNIKTENYESQVRILNNIVNLFYIRNDSKGSEYADTAINIISSHEVSKFAQALAWLSHAQMKFISGNFDKSQESAIKAIEISKKENLYPLFSPTYLLLGDLYKVDKLYYKANEQYELALQYSKFSETGIITHVYLNYGKCCIELGNETKARELFQEGVRLSLEKGNIEYRKDLLKELADINLAVGDIEAFKESYIKYISHIDSISLSYKEMKFNNMLISYQKLQLENRMKTAEVTRLKAEKKSQTFIAFFAITALILFFTAILFIKQKKMYKKLVDKHQDYISRLNKTIDISIETQGSQNSEADKNSADRNLFIKIEKLMQQDKIFRIKDISLEKIAEMTASNRTYISKAINTYSGMNFSGYINSYRIKEATQIIANDKTEIPFKQIAEYVGYNSFNAFWKAFLRETGCTPGRYRNELPKE